MIKNMRVKFADEQRSGYAGELVYGPDDLYFLPGRLFGLAAYTAESRIKEIGIRKVLGASVTSITALLSKEFLRLVAVSFIIASPIAWLVMHNWLGGYPYRISIQWWVFALTGMLAFFIALATVSFQAIRAALANPVRNLRAE